jgi:hypothetical protein
MSDRMVDSKGVVCTAYGRRWLGSEISSCRTRTCKIFVQEPFWAGRNLARNLAQNPLKIQNSRFFFLVSCKICARFQQRFFTRFLPASPPPKPSYHGYHVVQGRRGYRREYLYGRGVQWLELKPRAWRIKWYAWLSCIRVLLPSKFPAAAELRDAVAGGCVR